MERGASAASFRRSVGCPSGHARVLLRTASAPPRLLFGYCLAGSRSPPEGDPNVSRRSPEAIPKRSQTRAEELPCHSRNVFDRNQEFDNSLYSVLPSISCPDDCSIYLSSIKQGEANKTRTINAMTIDTSLG